MADHTEHAASSPEMARSIISLKFLGPTIQALDERIGSPHDGEEIDEEMSQISECISVHIETLISLHGKAETVR